jgi:hypothetical protein
MLTCNIVKRLVCDLLGWVSYALTPGKQSARPLLCLLEACSRRLNGRYSLVRRNEKATPQSGARGDKGIRERWVGYNVRGGLGGLEESLPANLALNAAGLLVLKIE